MDLGGLACRYVEVTGNGLTSINLENLSCSNGIDLSDNQLESIDLSSFSIEESAVAEINLSGNNYTSINLVGPWANLDAMWAYSTLRLENTQLTHLSFDPPVNMSTLVVKNNQYLQTMSFRNNQIETANGGYYPIDNYEISNNPLLSSVCTDPIESLDTLGNTVSGTAFFQPIFGPSVTILENCDDIVFIPDANFKNALVNTNCALSEFWGENPFAVDSNGDGEIQLAEAAAVAILDVSGHDIASLQGIEAFTQLRRIDCSNNALTSIDLSEATMLAELDCFQNQLNQLSVHFNDLDFYELRLDCSNNQLSDFEITADSDQSFQYMNFEGNQFTDFSAFENLNVWTLNLNNNPFVTFHGGAINFSLNNCPLLTSCFVYGDEVSLSGNPLLTFAKVSSAGIFEVHDNPMLQSISMKDGYSAYNEPDFGSHKDFTGNPSLEFVCIDDMGQWYNEGEWQFQHERVFVQVDPGVAITFYCDYAPGGGYNTITGSVAYDCVGSNAPATTNDIKLNMDASSDGSIQAVAFPDIAGQYALYTTGSGTITPEIETNYFTVTPPNATYAFTGSGDTQTTDFCISANGVHPDLEIVLIPTLPARPGFDAVYKIQYRNKGTEVQSGTVSLSFEDDVIDFTSAVPTIASQTSGTMTWNFTGLMPFESRDIDVTLNVNSPVETPAVNGGDVLDFTATVLAGTDSTPENNAYTLTQTVVNSFDPNDKSVSKSSISPDELDQYLFYTVRFENTGTFYAENIAIRDELSKNLDLTTLQVVSTSHGCRTLLTPQASNTNADKVEFFFEGIQLPATIDDPIGSHGFVTYKIKPKNNLVIGNTIVNEAEIYFDYNAPIVTNEVITTVSALSRSDFNTVSATLYPNPSADQFTVETSASDYLKIISVYNLIGQKIKSILGADDSRVTVDTTDLQAGTYLISIETGHGKTTKKLIKL